VISGVKKQRAKQLIIDEKGAGVRLIDELNDVELGNVLELEITRADELRQAFARHYTQGIASADEIDLFARYAGDLHGIPGLNSGPVADVIDAGKNSNIKGALREVRRANRR